MTKEKNKEMFPVGEKSSKRPFFEAYFHFLPAKEED